MVRFLLSRRAIGLITLACAAAVLANPKKKNKEEETQTLQLPRELPNALVGETRRLGFYVTPLSARGLLSQQVRDALKSLDRQSGSNTILKIRAFVAGSGDLRRVRDLVSEYFAERKQPLPVLSLVQAGGLPLEGAQVVLEGVAAAKKDLYPGGLAFFSAQPAYAESPLAPVSPLAEASLASLRQAVKDAGAEPQDVLRVTCFLSSLEGLEATRKLVESEYPRAAHDYLQTERAPQRALAACEAVAGLEKTTGGRLEVLGKVTQAPEESAAAVVRAPRVVLTGTQVSFGYEEQDARLAFQRAEKMLQEVGVSPRDVAFAQFYPLSQKIAAQVRKVQAGVFDPAHPPAGSFLLFEGLSSIDAGFAMDLVAAKD